MELGYRIIRPDDVGKQQLLLAQMRRPEVRVIVGLDAADDGMGQSIELLRNMDSLR